jgi:hypothetical protein
LNVNLQTMAKSYYNPYESVESIGNEAYPYIINNFPLNGDLTDLSKTIIDFIAIGLSTDSSSVVYAGSGSGSGTPEVPKIIQSVLIPILPNTVNGYINSQILNQIQVTGAQRILAENILIGINSNTADTLADYFDLVIEQLSLSNITDSDKGALYIAASISKSTAIYWTNQYNNFITGIPPINPWFRTPLYPSAPIIPSLFYQNLRDWVAATFVGSLSGYSQLQSMSVKEVNILSDLGGVAGEIGAVIGGLGMFSGKAVFKWASRRTLNISRLSGDTQGGASLIGGGVGIKACLRIGGGIGDKNCRRIIVGGGTADVRCRRMIINTSPINR